MRDDEDLTPPLENKSARAAASSWWEKSSLLHGNNQGGQKINMLQPDLTFSPTSRQMLSHPQHPALAGSCHMDQILFLELALYHMHKTSYFHLGPRAAIAPRFPLIFPVSPAHLWA